MSRRLPMLLGLVLILSMLVTACGATATATTPSSTSAPETQAPTKAPATPVPSTPTAAPPTKVPSTATPQGPVVGGTLVFALDQEPDSLDAHVSVQIRAHFVLRFIGSRLVDFAPDGQPVPGLAESWKVSEDGLVWDFTLKKGIKFHDGSPCTAREYAWTFQRALDPSSKSAVKSQLGPVSSVEAVDDLTLRFTFTAPYAPFLSALGFTSVSYWQPLSKTAIEKAGAGYGHQPMGVGPYRFKEWQVGQKIVLERNPDYAWGPSYVQAGAPYIQTIEFRIIPEKATITAGLEAGEIDYAPMLDTKDVARLKTISSLQVLEGVYQGLYPFAFVNASKPPFDDVRVRQAFSYAVDRGTMVKVVALGYGTARQAALSPSQTFYWAGAEKLGYPFDLNKAKALMKEAGYTAGGDGMLKKDGKPLKVVMKADPPRETAAVFLKEQYKALGVDIEIEMGEQAVFVPQFLKGEYEFGVIAASSAEADLLYLLCHSKGGLNVSQVRDAELDTLLQASREATDVAKRQEVLNAAQEYIIEKAYLMPLMNTQSFNALNTRVKGAVWSATTNFLYLDNAYIPSK